MSDMPVRPSPVPDGPARPKRSWCASHESEGRDSPKPVLTLGPRLTGANHGSLTLARVADQMSWPPAPPARFDEKTISRPSLRTFGWMSFAPASFSSAIGVAGPKDMAPCFSLTKSSPVLPGGRLEREKYNRPWMYEGPCSSSALFGPPGAQARCSGSLQPCAGLRLP